MTGSPHQLGNLSFSEPDLEGSLSSQEVVDAYIAVDADPHHSALFY